jgi:hypothetical protein
MGRYTDERCTTWWGNHQCLDELDHIDNDNGGCHSFDLSSLKVRRPVLVKAGARGLRVVEPAPTEEDAR